MSDHQTGDGIHSMVPREKMSEGARKLRDTYAITPGAPFYKREFGFYSLEAWKEQGMPQDVPHSELFDLDPPGNFSLGGLGWCEAGFCPQFEEEVIEDRGEHEVVRDFAGRHVLCFKGRRSGFMPEYLDHPVKDRETWEKNVKWRLDPSSPGRYADLDQKMDKAKSAAAEGRIIRQNVVGGYMYLRSLIGPVELLYAVYDVPRLIHDCMKAWFELADAVSTRHQQYVTVDEVAIGEDICYNHGPLISPDMIREFLLPYYDQLLSNIKARNIDRDRHVFFYLDTDGYSPSVLDLYGTVGMDVCEPFEVASGCDVVETGKQYPGLVIGGGIDKRELAKGRKAIDAMLERIIPPMRERGGYTPMCDHGVPAEVPYEDYLYYRRRLVELGE